MTTEPAPEIRPDMTALFMKDPLGMTDGDITDIIAHMRESRKNFIAGPTKAPSAKTAAPSKAKAAGLTIKLEL